MTACVNRKHTKKVAAVVTASLVGALSLGAAPVAAMADTGIETLALSAQDAFKQGTMTEARDGQNRRLEIPADGIITVEAGNYVKPTEITPKDGDPIDVRTDATIRYNINGAWKNLADVSKNDFMTPGTYQVQVRKSIDGIAATFNTTFIVADSADLSNATIFDEKGGVSDTTFTYNGQAQKIGFAIDGKKLTAGSDYIVEFFVPNNSGGFSPVSEVKGAGTYVANIYSVAAGGTRGTLEKQITFTVGKLNLASANISIADIDTLTAAAGSGAAVQSVSVDGDALAIGSDVTVLATLPSGSTGKASALVSAASGQSNVTGSKTVDFNVVKTLVNQVRYNGSRVVNGTTTRDVDINLADGESFKPERIEVYSGSKALDSSYYTVTYRDGNGNAVEASALANSGTYYAVVRVNAEASHFEYGSGELIFKVNITNGTVTKDDIVFKYDGKVGTAFTDTYTGEDFLPQIETIVHTKWGDDLVAGTDYTVQAYNAEGDKVDQIVDKGLYKVKIELKGNYGSSIGAADLECDFEVEAFNLSEGLFVNGGDLTAYSYDNTPNNTVDANDKTTWYLGYTGEAIEPSFELGYYTDADGNLKSATQVQGNADKLVWHALPADAYTVTGYEFDSKDVDEVKDKGDYKVQFALETGNYEITASGIDDEYTVNAFTVSTDRVAFADVPADAWYSQSVFQAKQLGYVSGISGTNLFAPENSITRADALVIISRMAGADVAFGEDWLSNNMSWITRYSDVDANAYYAKAVAWATKVGIVHGYGDGTFAPTKQITREEFATMLANYAKAMGDFDAADDSALDGMSDAASVSDWAEESVAWAVENGVMGNGGFIAAQSDITRAEVAAMAVNYQPDGISSGVIG